MLKLYYKSGRKYLGHTNSLLLSPKSYGRDFPPSYRPSLFLVMAGGRASQKRFFKTAENQAAGSLWVGGHRHVGILVASKLIWVLERFEVEKYRF